MKKRKKIIIILLVILIPILLLTVSLIVIYQVNKKAEEEKGLTFYLPRSSSFSSNWSYELSNNRVLKEVDHDVYDYLHIQFDYWEFRPIAGACGEVTIYFTAQYETKIVEEDSFSITYYVDENYNVTEISSENRPEKINFDGNEGNLLFLKVYDRWLLHIKNLIAKLFGAWA